jgi:hypothetical protein
MTAERAHAKTESLVSDVKAALHGIHGAGEALRGTSMQALDGVFHKSDGEARNKAIAEKGLSEMEPGRERVHEIRGEYGHGHGVEKGRGEGSHFIGARKEDINAHGGMGSGGEAGGEGLNERIAMGAARKATVEGYERNV